ncbi:type II toxin-antitoxin system PemK/MazF family toxin [Pectobacterium carotovorum]|uniref:type II toxin-antitoxin system PemK/MazF family toxin n=1 Tax=Pectobacterium carotovorum TaxID=554 RepID=UPI0029D5907C|nr:type II toxin-antitoxin system PemK/MazF family toxin [Pectobacterium carotovorum]MDX6917469.1 type II toxin-antitoxin system PemK/MazF family toxin [Pectobacterium carotovorum]
MSIIKINYYDVNNANSLLGEETLLNIDICELPYNPQNENVFIRRDFSNIPYSMWKVDDVQTTEDTEKNTITCDIYLNAVYFKPKSIAEKHGTNGSKLLRGRLVECDFGFFSQDYRSGFPPQTTLNNYNKKLPFEMVKRRLVVIISNREDPALVIPISKANKAVDARTVVEITSLPNDLVRFSNPQCYAKTAAITQVSGHRLFPLRYHSNGTKIYDSRIDKKLSVGDIKKIKEAALVSIGGAGILTELDCVKVTNEQANNEIILKNSKIEDLEKQVNELTKLIDDYTKP